MGNRIRAARRAAAMSQVQLAEAIGVSQQSVQKWERGIGPSRDKLAVIAGALGTTVAVLMGDDEPPTPPAEAVLQIAALAGEMTEEQQAKVEAYMRGLLES